MAGYEELGLSRRPTRTAKDAVRAVEYDPDILPAHGAIEISHVAFDQLPSDRGMNHGRELSGFCPRRC